jgi:hypothetical protein
LRLFSVRTGVREFHGYLYGPSATLELATVT